MRRLRTLAGTALFAGLFAGLTGCANQKGDLGADLDLTPVVATANGSVRSLLDISAPKDIPTAVEVVDVIDNAAESVDIGDSKSRVPLTASIKRAGKANAPGKNDVLETAGEVVRLPEAAQGEVVALALIPEPVVKPVEKIAVAAPVNTGAAPKLPDLKIDTTTALTPKASVDSNTPVATAGQPENKTFVAPVADISKDNPALTSAPLAAATTAPTAPVIASDLKVDAANEAAVKDAPVKVAPVTAASDVTAAEPEIKKETVPVAPPIKDEPVKVATPPLAVAAPEVASVDTAVKIKATAAQLAKSSGSEFIPAPAVPAVQVQAAVDNGTTNTVTQVADGDKPKETPPNAETPEQRADRLLKEASKLSGMSAQAAKVEADAAYQTGMRAFNDWNYETAKRYFEQAVQIDPLHREAADKLRICRSLLNIDVNHFGGIIRALDEGKRVEMQEQTIVLAHSMEEARALEVRGSENVLEADAAQKTRGLNERLHYLELAQDRYRRVIEIMNWMPPNFDLPQQRKQAEEALNRVRGKVEKVKEEVEFVNRAESYERANKVRTRESEEFKRRIMTLLIQVKALYDVNNYKDAETMALRVLTLDPLNVEAEKWKKKARAAGHTDENERTRALTREEGRRSFQDIDEAQIADDQLIRYPANWEIINKRQDATFGKKVAEETWKTDLRKKLQKKVSFEFVDTPLTDAIDFLRNFAQVAMIIDPKAVPPGTPPPPINLRVTDMNLDLALDWILKLADLDYELQDKAIFISKKQNLQAAVEMKIYDVSDLTQGITDFPGPEFQITVVGDKSANAGAGAGGNPFVQKAAAPTPTNASIADMIRNRVRPDTWEATQGTSIEDRAGRLIVMQRPEVHRLIDQLLANFRATQKMMINIESRFLEIREAYLENTGVEFQGLDPNVLRGDFGDIRRLGAPTGLIQPRTAGSTDGSPPNAPYPGIVQPGSSFSTVGSIVNHSINFFTNDPSTISSQDTGNIVRQGGLSAQVTVLNNTQVQAFIRALAVRENTSTLIAPRLTVFNTQRASMFVARQQSYVADYEISGDAYDPTIRQFLVGVVLDVKPIVSSDRRYVTMELRPTVTELVSFTTRTITSLQIFQGGNNTAVVVQLNFPIQFPELSIRRVRTTATVPDCGIMLVGGLYRNVKFNAENGVPFLSDLPVVGRMFRWNTVDNAKSNLAILVSPRIILFNEEEEKLLK